MEGRNTLNHACGSTLSAEGASAGIRLRDGQCLISEWEDGTTLSHTVPGTEEQWMRIVAMIAMVVGVKLRHIS